MAAYPEIDIVFRALADPSRRRLLDSLNARNGQTLRELCSGLEMARQSVSKHLGVLEQAGAAGRSCTTSTPHRSTRSANDGSRITNANASMRWRT